jgi:uncharacterized protein YecE (DUF72 family)
LRLIDERLEILGSNAGPVLFQLPPNFTIDTDRLSSFLRLLGRRHRYVFEFRHSSWYTMAVFKILRKRNIALCVSDHHHAPAPWRLTADFAYVRGHGPGGSYKGHYGEASLKAWAEQARRWKRRGIDVFIYFDNDQKAAAPLDAARLRERLA